MMRRASLISSLVLLIALLIVLCPCESASKNVIEETCKKTGQYYSLCVSTLKSNPKSANADAAGLARITLDILLPKVNATVTHALKLYEESDPSSDLYRFYGTCVDSHGGSVDRLIPNAVRLLGSKKFSEAQQDAAQVVNNADGCEEQFAGSNPLSRENREVHDLATVAADIIGSLS